MSGSPLNRRQVLAVGAAGAAAAAIGLPSVARAQAEGGALAAVRQRGRLTVGVYDDMPPFHAAGSGIDVDLAQALCGQLGLKLSLLPFTAGENMNDDLRNMVWRGHYLGFGPADLLLHVPVDRPLMIENPKVEIFGPYYRERVMIARDKTKVPGAVQSLADFNAQPIAVPGQSLAGWLLIGAESGRYAGQLQTKLKDGVEAAALLRDGRVAGAAALASELETVLANDPRFAIDPLPMPQMRNGWAVGCAVKKESMDLAQAVQGALNALVAAGDVGRMFARANVGWRQP